MVWVILASLLFILLLFWNVDRHYMLWKEAQKWPSAEKRVPINHANEFKVRLVAFAPVVLMFCAAVKINIDDALIDLLFRLFILVASAGMVAFAFWFLFNGMFNKKRNQDWFFKGTVDLNESNTDNFLRNKPVFVVILIQLGGFFFFLFWYVWLICKL